MDLTAFTDLSLTGQWFIRTAYGALLLGTLLQTLPMARYYFTSGAHRGYMDPSPLRDALLRPVTAYLVMGLWIACALALIVGFHTTAAAAVNLALSYYFFVRCRWSGILRGMGAPGFMTAWMGAWVFLLEHGLRHEPTGFLRAAAVFGARLDFALIMICAGIYKANAGYRARDGIELGTVNPWWGYWYPLFSRLRPSNPLFAIPNHGAYIVQVGAGLMMLVPATRELGGLLIAVSFLGIATQIRLGFLCELVVLCCFFMLREGSALDQALASVLPAASAAPIGPIARLPVWLDYAVGWGVLAYATLLPLAKAGQYLNFYGRRRLWTPLQTALERYTNFFGIIIWRVFTVDVIQFYAHIGVHDPRSGETRPYARYGLPDPRTRFRYWHVGEFVCLASLFTTLKYHPSKPELFQRKLARYARTLPCPDGWLVRFDYVLIRKTAERFELPVVAQFDVDPATGQVTERTLDPTVDLRAAAATSPVHEGAQPGSYAPLQDSLSCGGGTSV